jgi:branched-chain amino acid transport system permease protein
VESQDGQTLRSGASLRAAAVSRAYAGVQALREVTLELHRHEVVGLIGPNGAGKSTTFNLVTGVSQATRGTIRFAGERIDTLNARDIVRRGIGRTFQHVKLLPGMTVLENVAIGAHLRG